MTFPPSIYDLTLERFDEWDFSRPLFVQANRSPRFSELVDVFHGRLGLDPACSTVLTSATHPQRPWSAAQHLRNPEPRLSAATAAFLSGARTDPFSVVVTTTMAPIGDFYPSMRHHSNVACFCHAMEPVPSMVVNDVGQFAAARDFFLIGEHAAGSSTFVANLLVTPAEAEALFTSARTRPEGLVVEIGRFSGGTAVLLALAARASERPGVVSVDIERLPAAEYFCRVNGVDRDVQLLDGDSQVVASQWANRHDPGIATLFIDADHSYDAAVRDIATWTPYVVEGGTVALHDAAGRDCGVGKAIYHHLVGHPDFTNFRRVDTMVLCERRVGRV